MMNLLPLQKILQYFFNEPSLLEAALVHSSLIHQKVKEVEVPPEMPERSFDRLEFLGDRVLNLLVAELLYRHFPQESEGDLAKRFSALVCYETCADVAISIRLPGFLYVAVGTSFKDLRILCDALEAVLGAMYLDGGLAPCREFVKAHWIKRLQQEVPPKESKTYLQECTQALGKPIPVYELREKSGSEHEPHYIVAVLVEGFPPVLGHGSSKKTAEKDAAGKFVKQFGEKLTPKTPDL